MIDGSCGVIGGYGVSPCATRAAAASVIPSTPPSAKGNPACRTNLRRVIRNPKPSAEKKRSSVFSKSELVVNLLMMLNCEAPAFDWYIRKRAYNTQLGLRCFEACIADA